MLCFHFHSAQNILILWLISLTHGLFRSVVFSLQISEIFPNNFLLLIFNSSIVVREHTLYDLNVFKFEICFMVHNMSILINVLVAEEKNVYCAFSLYQLGQNLLIVLFKSFIFTNLLF